MEECEMSSFNKAIVMGNLTRDPELRYTQSGTAVATFGVAINEKYDGKENVVFIDVTAWGKLAETCNEFISKGKQVLIDGKLNYSSWEDDSGKKRVKVGVTASHVVFLGGGRKSEEGEEGYHDRDDDIPF
jgi:single-strand DNA-binding protein